MDKTVNINLIMSIYLEIQAVSMSGIFSVYFLARKVKCLILFHNCYQAALPQFTSHTANLLVFFLLVFPFPVSLASSFFL